MSGVEIRKPTFGDHSLLRRNIQPWLREELKHLDELTEVWAIRINNVLIAFAGYTENLGSREIRMIATVHATQHLRRLVKVLKHMLKYQPRPLVAYAFSNGKDDIFPSLCGFVEVARTNSSMGEVITLELAE